MINPDNFFLSWRIWGNHKNIIKRGILNQVPIMQRDASISDSRWEFFRVNAEHSTNLLPIQQTSFPQLTSSSFCRYRGSLALKWWTNLLPSNKPPPHNTPPPASADTAVHWHWSVVAWWGLSHQQGWWSCWWTAGNAPGTRSPPRLCPRSRAAALWGRNKRNKSIIWVQNRWYTCKKKYIHYTYT